MGFNSGFKVLKTDSAPNVCRYSTVRPTGSRFPDF